MQRIGEHLLDRAALDDLPGVHDEDVVRDVARAGEIVRDVQKREAVLFLQLQHEIQDPDADRDVEHARRLVGEDDLRLDGECARDRDALALTARELVRILVRYLLRRHETDGLEQLVHALVDLRRRDDVVDAQRPRDVVSHGLDRVQRAERVLEDELNLRAVTEDVLAPAHLRDVFVPEEHGAGGRVVQPCDESRHRALAAAALADERRDRAGTEREGNVLDGMHVLAAQKPTADCERLREIPDLEHAHASTM